MDDNDDEESIDEPAGEGDPEESDRPWIDSETDFGLSALDSFFSDEGGRKPVLPGV